MSSLSIDFSTYSVEDPVSGGGTWEAFYNGGLRIVDNGGTNMLFNDQSGRDGHSITTATQTFGAVHYAEVTVNTTTENYGIGPAVRCSTASGGSAYYIRLREYASPGANNLLYLINAGSESSLGSLSNQPSSISSGDKIGLLVNGSTVSWYYNPTAYDSAGLPTDGFRASVTNSSISGGQPGVCSYNVSTSPGTYVSDFYAADDEAPPGPSDITHYYTVYTSGNGSSATDANVKAGTGTGAVTNGSQASVASGTEQAFNISGLSSDTSYDLEWVATNAGGDTRGTAVAFSTLRASGSVVIATPPPIVRK